MPKKVAPAAKILAEGFINHMHHSNQNRFTGTQIRELMCAVKRIHDEPPSEETVASALRLVKRDPRVATTKVSTRVIYYSLAGACQPK